jgi:hypothetical protein
MTRRWKCVACRDQGADSDVDDVSCEYHSQVDDALPEGKAADQVQAAQSMELLCDWCGNNIYGEPPRINVTLLGGNVVQCDLRGDLCGAVRLYPWRVEYQISR